MRRCSLLQNMEIRDPEIQNMEIRDPEIQNMEIRDDCSLLQNMEIMRIINRQVIMSFGDFALLHG